MIDTKTGNINLTDSFQLTPKSNFQIVKDLNLGEYCEVRDMGNDHKWIDIKNIKIEKQFFWLVLLKMIKFYLKTVLFYILTVIRAHLKSPLSHLANDFLTLLGLF